jgi:5-methylthioribose kinase
VLLTTRSLPGYLIDAGLLDPRDVVDNELTIIDASRRGRNFKLRRGGGGLFIKQIGSWNAQSMALLRREAVCYRLAQDQSRFPGLAELVPRLLHYDEARHTLVMELLPDAENLTERAMRRGIFPVKEATMLGRTLGGYHSHQDRAGVGDGDLAVFPRMLPWILTLTELPDQHTSAAATQMVRMVKEETSFGTLMLALRDGWRRADLIHGDMKWDNCVVCGDGTSMRVVDWELADFGDARWDVGGIFQSYLSFWAVTLGGEPGICAEQLAASGPYSLASMQPAIRAFWQAYTERLELGPDAERDWLARSLRYAAARMVQTAYEHAIGAAALTAEVVRLLQISFNILNRPGEAVRDLLGFA